MRTLIGLFLFINSVIGYFFYEGTAFGDYIYEEPIDIIFFVVNFILSHIVVILIKTPGLSYISAFLLLIILIIVLLGITLVLPYLIIFELFGFSGVFWGVVCFVVTIGLLGAVMAPILRYLLEKLEEFITKFFDGLKQNTIDNMLNKSK